MPTFAQLTYKYRTRKRFRRKYKAPAFGLAPQRKGVIYKIATMTPRKPNSARRTLAKIKLLYNQKRVFAKIPGIGDHFLQAHSIVMLRGHGPKDSPGLNYHLIRGLCDFIKEETFGRKNRRSKFGLKFRGDRKKIDPLWDELEEELEEEEGGEN
jgi:small subunit ribosomal protein S12